MPGEPYKLISQLCLNSTGQKAPRFVLCDQHGSSLEPALVPLADSLVEFELNLFQRVHAFHKKQTSCTDEERKTEAVRWVGEYKDFLQQRKDIENGQRRFSHSYLRDESFVPIWTEGLRVVKNVFKNSNSSKNQTQKQNVYMGYITSYEKQARTLQNQMVDIALQGLLEEPIINSIRNRWVKLDSSIEWYYEWRNRTIDPVKNTSTRIAPKWLV
jgi:hypothetical protein